MTAASRPRFSTSCNPTCKELNWPRLGSGLVTTDAPFAYAIGAKADSFLPTTMTTKSVASRSERIAAEGQFPFGCDSFAPARHRLRRHRRGQERVGFGADCLRERSIGRHQS